MELSDYLRVLRRHWRVVAITTLCVVSLVALVTAISPREYRAQAQLFVSTSAGGDASDLIQGGSFTQLQVTTYADIITTQAVMQPVIDSLGLDDSPRQLAARTVATVPPNTVLINVAVTDSDPVAAAEVANAVADQFTTTVQELVRVASDGSSPVKATVVEPAVAPLGAASPNPVRNLALGLVLGLLLGLGLAIVRDLLDTRVRGESDVARVTEAPTVGAIAFDSDASAHPLAVQENPHGQRAEAFRTLRTNLQFLNADHHPRTLVLTSTIPGEGKTTTTANLALAIAESGARVCLIEGDLRRPRLLDYLGLENAVGLTSVLVGQADLEDMLQPYAENLVVLGCGPIPPNPSELLGSTSMKTLLIRLEEEFDYVLIDSPPLLPVTDAAVLSTLVDGTMVVVGAGVVKRDELGRALANLAKVDSTVLGVVLNRLPVKGPDAYQYSYNSYRPDSQEERRDRRAKSRKLLGRSKSTAASQG